MNRCLSLANYHPNDFSSWPDWRWTRGWIYLALILPISLAGTAVNFSLNKINWPLFLGVAIAGVIGAIIGSYFIQKTPAIYAKRAFAIFLMYSAYRLWMK